MTPIRAGRYVRQPGGYRAFIPTNLPPDPPVDIDSEMLALLSSADQALGRLDGAARILPNPDLFVATYVRQEAVLSSQIEGTQSTLDDVLEFELKVKGRTLPQDVGEVVNYVKAMNYGLERLETLPLSLRLIREIHGQLLLDTRGGDRQPGEFRQSQNWIGAADAPLSEAAFIPPPPYEMNSALDEFEKYLRNEATPVLIHCGLTHAQFETVHPFTDGNGRVGRLLITFLLCHRRVLHRPLLYLSYYLKQNRTEYYDRLMAIRMNGDWEGWLKFFLRGVAETAEMATATVRTIVDLRESHRAKIQQAGISRNGLRLLDLLYESPIVSIPLVEERLAVSYGTADSLVAHLERQGLLQEITGAQRNRRYRYGPFLQLFDNRVAEAHPGPRSGDRGMMRQTASRKRAVK